MESKFVHLSLKRRFYYFLRGLRCLFLWHDTDLAELWFQVAWSGKISEVAIDEKDLAYYDDKK